MTICPTCNSENIIKKGIDKRKFGLIQRFKCNSCQAAFSIPIADVSTYISEPKQELTIRDISESNISSYKRSADWLKNFEKVTRYVITSAQSNTEVDSVFLKSLMLYCEHHNAMLFIIPIRYKNPTSQQEDSCVHSYDKSLSPFLIENNLNLHPKLKMLGSLKIAATTEYPLTGLAPVTKGSSIIVGHNQLQTTTLPVQSGDLPVIMTTTGTVSKKNYSETKQGYKAEFNHSNSAVVVELDDDIFHMRHLNFDGKGFYDFTEYYTHNDITEGHSVHAIITGDEHALFACEKVRNATYEKDGLVDLLKPKFIVRHDVLDCYTINHHDRNNFLKKYKKFIVGKNNMMDELQVTMDYIVDTTPKDATNIIVSSNHNDHLARWLNECDPRVDNVNAKLYHFLMFRVLEEIEKERNIPNPFKLIAMPFFETRQCQTYFTERNETLKMFDIEIAMHGDKGANGSRGSRDQFANLPSKAIIGHSHSPGIEKGCYQVGTSSILKMDYNDGPSSWLNTHCLIYPNGKRQLINIVEGKWRSI